MDSRLQYLLDSLRERLWVKPAFYACLALIVILAARFADTLGIADLVPDINAQTIEALVTIISASMLGVSTFAVASMVSAYSAASRSTTPRAFSLLVKDRASQNALSSFIGAFIFSVAGIVAVKTEYYGDGGRFVLFLLAMGVMLWVVVTFVRWVDEIARLGRMDNTVNRVEEATMAALEAWGPRRTLGAMAVRDGATTVGDVVHATTIGYVRHVDVEALQDFSAENDTSVTILARPGSLVTLDRPLLSVVPGAIALTDELRATLRDTFVIADARTFTQDPRLGLISLSEIASRALSPAVNDPGTAIACVARMAKVLSLWNRDTLGAPAPEEPRFPRVSIEALSLRDVFEDAFAAVARDGAGCVEVCVRLQKALAALACLDGGRMTVAAREQAAQAMERAEGALEFDSDLARVRAAHALVM